MLMTVMGMAMMGDKNLFGVDRNSYSDKPQPTPKINKSVQKELHLFNIGGCEVMAYSRKDAIKRLEHGRKQSK